MISNREAKDILISVLAISLALTIATSNDRIGVLTHIQELPLLISFFAVTVGTGFVLHELAHKVVAIRFGCVAEFRMWFQGLILALLTSMIGLVFVAPGAVYIYATSRITKQQNGLISLAGPFTNLVLSIAFLALAYVIPMRLSFPQPFGLVNVWFFASKINASLGLFNMVPIFPLDGSKIMDWSMLVWGAFGLILLFMFMM